MSDAPSYQVILFQSVHHAMWADRLLKDAGIARKLIPVPRHLSSDCGVCIRIEEASVAVARAVLDGVVEYSGIVAL